MQPVLRLNHDLLAVERDQTVHVMLELSAPDPPSPEGRTPLRLALVIDRSGSMAGEKLAVTKACAAYLVRRLGPGDELAIVSYDDEVSLVAPLQPVVVGDGLVSAIGQIWHGGSTNLSGGWLKGLEVLRPPAGGTAAAQAQAAEAGAEPAKAEVAATRRVLLLTDGLANVGVTEPGTLVGMAGAARAEGVGTTTVGFGEAFAESLLTAMADAGGGNAHFAPTPDAAPAIFAEEFEGLASVVAQNVSVEIRPSHDVVLLEVLNRYPGTPVAGGVQLALGDAYGGERRSVVFSLHVPALADLGTAKVADVVLRYVSLGERIATHEVTLPVVVNVVTADQAAQAAADHGVVEEVVILKAAQARDEARRRADEGDFAGAEAVLRETAAQLRVAASDPASTRAQELVAEADSLEESTELVSGAMYDASTQKRLHYDSYANRRRRRREP